MRVALHYLGWLVGLARAQTQTTERERHSLARYAQGRRRLVEIGVWHGVTTACLRGTIDPSGEISAVDPYPAGRLGFSVQERIARREVDRVERGRVRWINATGAQAAVGHGKVEFIFIDGDHTEAACWRTGMPGAGWLNLAGSSPCTIVTQRPSVRSMMRRA